MQGLALTRSRFDEPRADGLDGRRPGHLLLLAGDIGVLVLAAAGVVLQVLDRHTASAGIQTFRGPELVAAVAFAAGAMIMNRAGVRGLAVLATAVGASQAVAYLAAEYGVYAEGTRPGSLPAGAAAVWVSVWFGQWGYWLVPATLLLLPDGRLRNARWRWALAAALAAAAVSAAGWGTFPYADLDSPVRIGSASNPVGGDARLASTLLTIGLALGAGAALSAVVGLVLRFRETSGVARQQLKWVLVSGAATVTLMALSLGAGPGRLGDLLLAMAFVPLPVGVAVAVARYRLWDVDVVINRALVYLVLTAATVAVYAVVVVSLGALLGSRLGAPLVATVIVALALQPLRTRVQRAADRLLYGATGQPFAALSRLGHLLEGAAQGGGDAVQAVAVTVATTLRLPAVAVLVDGSVVGGYGDASLPGVRLPLIAGRAKVGELHVAFRAGERSFRRRDLAVMTDLARHVAAAIRSDQLARDVRLSRERSVLALEEERRRIRRDLHDELGPRLAGTALELDQARWALDTAPAVARAILTEQAAGLRQTVSTVRRLVHDLRPPALDDGGLERAVRDQIQRLSSAGTRITLSVDGDLDRLTPVVQATAYRIVSEALTNVVRHAGAATCSVAITADDAVLTLLVVDDGRGFPAGQLRGVGLRSMSERAEELGGSVTVDGTPGGGTRVCAWIPRTS